MNEFQRSLFATCIGLVLLGGAASCGGGGDDPVDPVAATPARLDVVSGNNQNAVVGTQLPDPLVVRVVDASGNPVRDQLVNFRIVKGGGSVFAGAASTNADGIVQERWTLGTVARDTQQAEARAVDNRTGAAIVFATFKAVGQPGAAADLRKVKGDAQPGPVGQPLPDSLVVRVVDAYGNGVAGSTVTWTAASGTLSAATSASDTGGRAGVRWTLGGTAGSQQATARSGTLPVVAFTAMAQGGPPASIAKMSIDAGEYAVATSVGDSVAVRVTDAYGNPSAGATVTFSVTAGNGNISPTTVIANADGIAKTRWVLGTIAGANALRVLAAPGVEAQFTATGRAGSPASITKRTADPATAMVGSIATPAPSVLVHDAYANPVPAATVSFAVTAGGGVVTGSPQSTDASGIATVGQWTLGTTAGMNTLTATVAGLAALTFATTTSAGTLASLTMVSGDEQQAPVGTQLLAPLVVGAADQYGNPLAGVTVTWAITSGGGSLTSTSTTTNAQGRASVYWRVGMKAGANGATATAGSLPSVAFSASGTVGAPVSITIVGGNGGSGPAGSTLSDSLAVLVRDAASVPVPGVTVTWSATGGAVSPATGVTGDDGIARSAYMFGTTAGSQGATATVGGLTPASFALSATPGPIARVSIAPHRDTLFIGKPMQLAATVTDAYGNVRSDAVGWRVVANPASAATVDASGLVSGSSTGTAKVIASAGSVADTASLTVLHPVASVTITLARPKLHVGDTTRATIIMKTAQGFAVERPYTLRVGNPGDSTIASVDASGLVTANKLGAVNVFVTVEGLTAFANLQVVEWGIATVKIDVDSVVITAGEKRMLTATMIDSSGQVVTWKQVTWYAPNNTIADIAWNGELVARSPGNATVRAFRDGGADTIPVRVLLGSTSRVDVTVADSQRPYPGDSVYVTARALDAGGNAIPGKVFTWASGDPGRLGVRSAGNSAAYATAIKGGRTHVIASVDGVTGSAPVNVLPAMVWTPMATPAGSGFSRIWGRSANEIYALGSGGVYRYDGSTWAVMPNSMSVAGSEIWGTDAGLFTRSGTEIFHFDGTQWAKLVLPDLSGMKLVWASAPNDVWAVYRDWSSFSDRLAHYTGGTGWTTMSIVNFTGMDDLWGTSKNEVFVTGYKSYTYRYNGTHWGSFGGVSPDYTGSWIRSSQPNNAWSYYYSGSRAFLQHNVVGGGGGNVYFVETARDNGFAQPSAVWLAQPQDVYTIQQGIVRRYMGYGFPRRLRTELPDQFFSGVWGVADTVYLAGSNGIMKGTPAP